MVSGRNSRELGKGVRTGVVCVGTVILRMICGSGTEDKYTSMDGNLLCKYQKG